jgi:photosystem II stability/assembly factor-like uncharacterized protein
MRYPSSMRTTVLIALLSLTATTQAQFQLQDSHSTASFRGIHSLGNGVAWASGTEGTVLRTTDDGANWERCTTPPDAEKLDFRGIQAFDQNTAIVMSSGKGDLSRLYKTTDACKTWKLVFTNPDKDGFWDSIKIDPKEKVFGSLVGDPVNGRFAIFLTFDGGNKWERRRVLPEALDKEGLFAASNSSLVLQNNGMSPEGFITGGPNGARLLMIAVCGGGDSDCFELGDFGPIKPADKNRGKLEQVYWQKATLPLAKGDSAGAFSIGVDDQSGYWYKAVIVGGDYKDPTSNKSTAAYTNLKIGRAYLPAQTPPHGYRSSVAHDATTKTWITVGPNGTDTSRDDGKNWTALKPAAQDPPDADKNWNALSLPFAVGPKGRIGKLRPEALKP